jgi:multidrug resistance efflux pump
MTVTEINRAIMFGSLTNTELDSVISAVKWARAQLGKTKIRSFSPGSAVKFTSNRDGRTYTGTVRKIAIKYVTVDTGRTLFRVPANMLEEV